MRFIATLISLIAVQAHFILGCCAHHDHSPASACHGHSFAERDLDSVTPQDHGSDDSQPEPSPAHSGTCTVAQCAAVQVKAAAPAELSPSFEMVSEIPTAPILLLDRTELRDGTGVGNLCQAATPLYLLHQVFLI